MAWISTKTIITSLSLFHLTLAFFFLVNPVSIADQAMVFFLGEAASLPPTTTFLHPSPPLSFCAAVLLLLGLSDLSTLSSLPEAVWLNRHWSAQAPLRSAIFAGFALYAYLSNTSAAAAAGDAARIAVDHLAATSGGREARQGMEMLSRLVYHPASAGSGGPGLFSAGAAAAAAGANGAASSSTGGSVGGGACGVGGAFGGTSGADGLRNRVFFTFAVLEFLGWLWVWVTMREEKSALLEAAMSTRKKRKSSSYYGTAK